MLDSINRQLDETNKCVDSDIIKCEYWDLTDNACTSIITKSCDYYTFSTTVSYNTTTEILSGYITYSGTITSSKTKLFIVLNGTSIPIENYTITPFSSVLSHINFTVPIGIVNWFSTSYTVAWKLVSDRCYETSSIMKEAPLQILLKPATGVFTGLPVAGFFPNSPDITRSSYFVDIPYIIINPRGDAWNIKSVSVTVNSVSRAATFAQLNNPNFVGSGISIDYIRLQIPYLNSELIPAGVTITSNINIGYSSNSATLSTLTTSINTSSSNVFIGYDI